MKHEEHKPLPPLPDEVRCANIIFFFNVTNFRLITSLSLLHTRAINLRQLFNLEFV